MSRAERILHVPRRFVPSEWGGTETVILELSRRQQKSGWKPEILTTLALSDVRQENFGGVPIRRFGYKYPYFGLSADERLVLDKKAGNMISPSLFGALLSGPPVRIFHGHALSRLGGEVLAAARLRRRPCVFTLHGGVFDVPRTEAASWSAPVRGKLDWGKPFGALLGVRSLLERADHVICVGQAEYDAARAKLPHERVSFLSNGVDPEKFREGNGREFRRRHEIPQDAFLILNVSRIDAQKNQLALLEAFQLLQARVPAARLALVGPVTQPDYRSRIEAFIRENGLTELVCVLPGFQPNDSGLVDAYHACDAFVLPSVHEPFGIVVLEAWACKKPVVASNAGGLKALVRPEETGLQFDPKNGAGELAERLLRLHDRPQERARLGEAGWREVEARYTWEAVEQAQELIYQAAEEHAHG